MIPFQVNHSWYEAYWFAPEPPRRPWTVRVAAWLPQHLVALARRLGDQHGASDRIARFAVRPVLIGVDLSPFGPAAGYHHR